LPKTLESGLDHVVRRRILRALHGRTSGEANPADLSERELADETLSGVSYHLGVLLRHGIVMLERTEVVRGSVRHTYVSTVEDEPTALSVLAQTEELDAPGRDAVPRNGDE